MKQPKVKCKSIKCSNMTTNRGKICNYCLTKREIGIPLVLRPEPTIRPKEIPDRTYVGILPGKVAPNKRGKIKHSDEFILQVYRDYQAHRKTQPARCRAGEFGTRRYIANKYKLTLNSIHYILHDGIRRILIDQKIEEHQCQMS